MLWGFTGHRMLAVHKHNFEDIRNFAKARLENHPRWEERALREAQKLNLVDEIAKRSEGVFLWAFLVTRSLREGMTNDDTIEGLELRLQSLPSDLEILFKRMLDGVNPIYHEKMSAMFQVALNSDGPLRWEVYHHLDQGYADPEWAFNVPIAGTPSGTLEKQCDQTSRRINARSRGLLSVDAGDSGRIKRVHFLHRTVYDFLHTAGMEEYLSSKLQAKVDIYLSMFRAYVAWIKTAAFVFGMEVGVGEDIFTLCKESLAYAALVDKQASTACAGAIAELYHSIGEMACMFNVLEARFYQKPGAARAALQRLMPPAIQPAAFKPRMGSCGRNSKRQLRPDFVGSSNAKRAKVSRARRITPDRSCTFLVATPPNDIL